METAAIAALEQEMKALKDDRAQLSKLRTQLEQASVRMEQEKAAWRCQQVHLCLPAVLSSFCDNVHKPSTCLSLCISICGIWILMQSAVVSLCMLSMCQCVMPWGVTVLGQIAGWHLMVRLFQPNSCGLTGKLTASNGQGPWFDSCQPSRYTMGVHKNAM